MSTETATIFEQPLGFLDLSPRAYIALTNFNIKSVGALVRRTRGELVQRVHNFGGISCDNVEVQLKRHKLHLGMSDESMLNYLDARGGNISLNLSVDVLRSVKTRQINALKRAKILTFGDLVERTKEQLLALDDLSDFSVDRIIDELKVGKLALKPTVLPMAPIVKTTPSTRTGVFTHDCKRCKFLGTFVKHDIYVCTQGGLAADLTLVARFGPRGHEYTSGASLILTLNNVDIIRLALPKKEG